MKTTEANEDRRISDITKRISQLSHTIYEMNAFLSENSYQKAVLSQRFEREFDSIREHHDTIIHDIITSLHTKKSDLSDDIEQLFANRLNEMSHDFEEFKHKLSIDVKESEQHMISELSKLSKSISEISTQITGLVEQLDEPLTDINENATGGGLTNLKMKFQCEITAHDEKSQQKFRVYEDETSQRLAKLDGDYRKAVENLKKQFMMSSKQVDALGKYQTDMKAKSKALRDTVDTFKSEIESLNRAKQQLNDARNSAQSLVLQYKKELNEQKEALESLSKELDKDQELPTPQESNQKEEELHELERALTSWREKAKEELKQVQESMSLNTDTSQDELEIVENRYQEEISKLQEAQAAEELSLSKNIQFLTQKLDTLTQKSQNDRNFSIQELNQLKEKHKQDQESLLHKISGEMSDLLKRISDAKVLVRDVNTIQELQNTLETMKQNHSQEVKEIEESTETETSDLAQTFLSLMETTKKDHDQVLENLVQESAKVIEQRKIEHETLKNTKREQLRNDHEVAFTQCRKNLEDNGEIRTKIGEYKTELADLNHTLQVLNEKVDTESVIRELDDQIKNLSAEKEQRMKDIQCERPNLVQEWEAKLREEENRHEAVMRELLDVDFTSRLVEMRENGKTKLDNLDQVISDLKQSLKTLESVNMGLNSRNFDVDSEVKALTKSLEDVRNLLKQKRREAQKRKDTEIEEAQQRNTKTDFEFQSEIEEYQRRTEESLMSFTNSHSLLSNELEVVHSEATKRFRATKAKLQAEEEVAKKKLIDYVEELRCLVKSAAEHGCQTLSLMKDEFEQKKAKMDEQVSRLENENERYLVDQRQKLANLSETLEKLLNDVTHRRDDAKRRAQNKPMREEERKELERLQNKCDMITKQLTSILKDAMGYRSRMKQQEATINERFGGPRQIAVLKSNQPGGPRSTSNIVKRKPLPPLVVET